MTGVALRLSVLKVHPPGGAGDGEGEGEEVEAIPRWKKEEVMEGGRTALPLSPSPGTGHPPVRKGHSGPPYRSSSS
jgi:hypothetical protein